MKKCPASQRGQGGSAKFSMGSIVQKRNARNLLDAARALCYSSRCNPAAFPLVIAHEFDSRKCFDLPNNSSEARKGD
jgi:hypothetical protein